eukprot:5554552-Prymnesium_polylepis.1
MASTHIVTSSRLAARSIRTRCAVCTANVGSSPVPTSIVAPRQSITPTSLGSRWLLKYLSPPCHAGTRRARRAGPRDDWQRQRIRCGGLPHLAEHEPAAVPLVESVADRKPPRLAAAALLEPAAARALAAAARVCRCRPI